MRAQAEVERRTISAYVVNIVLRQVEIEESIEYMGVSNPAFRAQNRGSYKNRQWKAGERTAILARLSIEEAERIRAAARRKNMRISDYLLNCVRRTLVGSLPAKFFLDVNAKFSS